MSPSAPNQPQDLRGWLTYLESIHPSSIDMGLERIRLVFDRLALDFNQTHIITVAGTNGKGTTCAMIEQGLLLAGKSTAVYSSPHLLDYRERVRINNALLSEQDHCLAFARVEQARGDISLTYFEFGTLAALVLIAQSRPDYVILEVGLGGRLDAVNILDAGIAVITTIGLDHQDYLGTDREQIGAEKAGILRQGCAVVIGEPDPPQSLINAVDTASARAFWQGREFSFQINNSEFVWCSDKRVKLTASIPAIPPANAATALQVLELTGLIDNIDLPHLLAQISLPGRCQLFASRPDVLLDVAHNPQAVAFLCQQIKLRNWKRLHLVVGMLADKDIQGCLELLTDFNPQWYLADLSGPRAAKAEKLASCLVEQHNVSTYKSVRRAYQQARSNAAEDDMILVFGSFLTLAEVMESDE
ncbi:bifunctional tetrahydrofolate synthase/dihydrofolate synthase [Lacimicrobium alkaliphilum]|uniref:Dihydrofolate synthase/folylpolyglutamate synthase n=1 Tax=Lacimicrobium alkaliphilum TaxID=1526571 RepID=A0ABQ1RHK7_9ALTE|nr:bifunctional tetrahydrofolate synthase/dihydrofolate synthase [Lacimicrobium alkaliphilum]GGD67234.1 bifunctional protein FolC [Lacimicrobium alkaliphilum]